MSSCSSSSSSSSATVVVPDVSVLFKDCGDVWCPLERLYFSTSSNQLVSRHPLLSLEEVISSYCPQCLTRYTDEEALAQNNRCRTCFHCPHCGGVLVAKDLAVREGLATPLVCTSCSWECVHDIITNPTTTKHTHHHGMGEEVDSVFAKLLNAHKHSEQTSAKSSASEDVPLGSWRWEDLARKIDQREKTTFHTNAFEDSTCLGAGVVVYEAENAVLGVPLCTKKTLRSRQDFESGKMNILVQPKPSPLDGDSSMKLQKGKWWIKDSSAIHDLPFVSVIKLPSDANPYILIRLTNPKDIDASVKFLLSNETKNEHERFYLECDSLGAFQWREIPDKLEVCSNELSSFTINGYEDELLREEAENSVPLTLREGGWSVQVVGNHAFVQIPLVDISSRSGSRVHIPLRFQWSIGDRTLSLDVMVQFST